MMKVKMLLFCLLMAGWSQVYAVSYTPLAAPQRNSSGTYYAQMQVSHPTYTFQSTSTYAVQWKQEDSGSMLNADGTVSTEYYGIGNGPRRVGGGPTPGGGTNGPGTPGNPDDDDQQPIGDGLWVLLLLAVGYMVLRRSRWSRNGRDMVAGKAGR